MMNGLEVDRVAHPVADTSTTGSAHTTAQTNSPRVTCD
jgi:hypothetical protein